MLVTDEEEKIRLPFSRGILTRSIMLAGIDVGLAYAIASEVQRELEGAAKRIVSTDEIRELTYRKLLEKGLREQAERYLLWRELKKRKIRIAILIGGATGVGKSTISTEIAFRLGIRSIIGTDTIREVMRKMIAPDLLPDIHVSSFLASEAVNPPAEVDPLLYGFRMQVKHVSTGIAAVLERSRREGFNALIEGIHVVPGFVDLRGNEFMYLITVPDRDYLEAHFYERARYSLRDPRKYIENIDRIMEIQNYLIKLARKHGVPIVENVELEKTVGRVISDVIRRLEKSRG